jgi:hypothetical protein
VAQETSESISPDEAVAFGQKLAAWAESLSPHERAILYGTIQYASVRRAGPPVRSMSAARALYVTAGACSYTVRAGRSSRYHGSAAQPAANAPA